MAKKRLKSLILKYFPMELLLELHEIMYYADVDNNTKSMFVSDLLTEYNIPFDILGCGTNRYGILIDGIVVKIALDNAGTIDNKREFKYVRELFGKTCRVHECLVTGLVATFQYYSILSYDDFLDVKTQDMMRKILNRISKRFLIGDVGISSVNYANWGFSPNGELGMIDFAYVYATSFKSFMCRCEHNGILDFEDDFNFLVCPFCKTKYSFTDIRRRISREDQLKEIGDISKLGYILRSIEEVHEITSSQSIIYSKEKNEKIEDTKETIIIEDEDDISDEQRRFDFFENVVKKYRDK